MENKRAYNRPLGKGSRGPYRKGDGSPPVPLPEYIRLPDGRKISVAELLKYRPERKHYNLLAKKNAKEIRPPAPGRPNKYTQEDREWQSRATTEEIMKRYNMTAAVARTVRSYARRLLQSTENQETVIYDYTKKSE